MSNIGAVIGWKHNHQSGMSTRKGVITEFPGGIPSQADQDKWTAEYLLQFPEGFDAWKETMAKSDSSMTRMWEDFLTLNGTDGLPQITKDRHISKVALRATKPEAPEA